LTSFADHKSNHQPIHALILGGHHALQARRLWLSCFLAVSACALCVSGPALAQGSDDLLQLLSPSSFGPPTWSYQFRCQRLIPGTYWELRGVWGAKVTGVTVPSTPAGWDYVVQPTRIVFTYSGAAQSPAATWYFPFTVTAPDALNAPVPWQSYLSNNPASGEILGPSMEYQEGSIAVTVYDNWIGFGDFGGPIEGSVPNTYVMPEETPASAWSGTSHVPGANDYDIAGFRVTTGARLNLIVDFGGHLRRVTPDGSAFAGIDTRKLVPGPYELATEWKIKFRGAFLDPLTEMPFVSPSSGQVTAFDTWTQWGPGSDTLTADAGWQSPSNTDAWTGTASTGTTSFVALVERLQGVDVDPLGGAAEVWITERVLRRGMRDVAGNYRQDVQVTLTVAE